MTYPWMTKVLVSAFTGATVALVGYAQAGYGTNVFMEGGSSEAFDAGDFFDSADGPVLLPQVDTIVGASIDGLDIDLYQLSLTDAFSNISVSIAGGRRGLNLFNEAGQFLSPVEPVSRLPFAGEAGDTFFLAVDGAFPVVSDTAPLTLLDWDTEGRAGILDIVEHEVTFEYSNGTTTQVPEPLPVVGLSLLGGLGLLASRAQKIAI